MNTKNIVARAVAFVLALMVALSFPSCGKDNVSEALDSYEAYIGKMEQALKKQDIASLFNLAASAVELSVKIAALEGTSDWRQEHTERLAALTARYAAAAAHAIGGGAADTASGKNQIDALLDAYEGFVVKMEKAAAQQDTLSLTSLMQSAVELSEQLEDADSDEFTAAQTSRYIDLTARYAKALTGMDENSFDLSAFGL